MVSGVVASLEDTLCVRGRTSFSSECKDRCLGLGQATPRFCRKKTFIPHEIAMRPPNM